MRKGRPEQLIAELENKISELRGRGVNSSSVIIDDDEDLITADEEILEEPSNDEYLDTLYSDVETELGDLVQGVAWNSDEENIYMDVNFQDGHVITFTIPKADLQYDLNSTDMDVEYICTAVRDAQEPTFADSEELTFADSVEPAYL